MENYTNHSVQTRSGAFVPPWLVSGKRDTNERKPCNDKPRESTRTSKSPIQVESPTSIVAIRECRFTRQQIAFIYVGLRTVYLNYMQLLETGSGGGAHPEATIGRLINDSGTFNNEFMEAMLGLWRLAFKKRTSGCRVKLNYVSIATSLFAVRVALQQLEHKHVQPWAPRLDHTSRQLTRRLQQIQKQLKRSYVSSNGEAAFHTLSDAWHEFLRWIRLHLLSCKCTWRLRNRAYRLHQSRISHFVEITKAELLDRKECVPGPREVRRLVRQALSYVRRGRKPYHMYQLLTNRIFAAAVLCDYVVQRTSPAEDLN